MIATIWIFDTLGENSQHYFLNWNIKMPFNCKFKVYHVLIWVNIFNEHLLCVVGTGYNGETKRQNLCPRGT